MSELITTFPARTGLRTVLPAETLRGLMQSRLPDPTILDETEPFFWSAEISSTRLDEYFTHMDISSLSNYAADAIAGVSFQDSHRIYQLGYGQSLHGVVRPLDNGEVGQRVLVDFYTMPGIAMRSNTYSDTDSFIKATRAGLWRDVSIGFRGGKFICDICGEPVYGRTECPHIPGIEYGVGDQGLERIIATAAVVDAHLGEVSAVYDGATPGAMLQKITDQRNQGKLDHRVIKLLCTRYNLDLPEREKLWSGVDLSKSKRSTDMGKQTTNDESETRQEGQEETRQSPPAQTPAAAPVAFEEMPETRSILDLAGTFGAPSNKGLQASVRWLGEQLAAVRTTLKERDTEIQRLTPIAADGETYKRDLIEATLKDGARAMGKSFSEATYRSILEGLSLDKIKELRAGFVQQGNEEFPGGRRTNETPEPQGEGRPAVQLPGVLYS